MMKWLIVIVTLQLAVFAFSQPAPDTLWTRTYGGNGYDQAYSVQQTSDGGYILAGGTNSFGAGLGDFYLVKTDSSGDTLWTKTYGSILGESAKSIQQTIDGGYIVAGHTQSFSAGGFDFYLVKTESDGDTLWTHTYGGSDWDEAYSVQQTTDDGYIIAGYTYSFGAGNSDLYLVKTDNDGDTLWTKTYGGSDGDFASSVQQTVDGGYIVAGGTYSFGAGGRDFYLVKTDSMGDTLWTNTFGGEVYDNAFSVQQTNDRGFIIAGETGSFGIGNEDFYLVKTDSIGNTVWTNTYGGRGAASVQQTSDMGYIMAGKTVPFGAGTYYAYIVKTDCNGYTLWTQTYGGDSTDMAVSIEQTTDGGFIVAGKTQTYGSGNMDFYIVRIDVEHTLRLNAPNGNEEWQIFQADTVQWFGSGFEGGIKIELNRDYPTGEWEILVDSTANDGIETVFVTEPPSNNCRIKVSALFDTLSDISDSDFSIISSNGGYLALIDIASPESPIIAWEFGLIECPLSQIDNFRFKNFGDLSTVVFSPETLTAPEFSSACNCPPYFALSPGEISACSLTITYSPSGLGIDYDTLRIMTDAANAQGGYVRIPLTGQQISTPAVPQVTISFEGDDARLTWDPITESVLGCSIDVTYYLIFYSEIESGPYFYLAYTSDTTYVHLGAPRFTDTMFYQALALTDPLDGLAEILAPSSTLTREEVLALLHRRSGSTSRFSGKEIRH